MKFVSLYSSELAATTMDFASAQQLLGPGFMSTPPQPPVVPSAAMPFGLAPQQPHPTSVSSSMASNSGTKASENSLKKGPQVLIKNVNGKVVITPVAETQPAGKKVRLTEGDIRP